MSMEADCRWPFEEIGGAELPGDREIISTVADVRELLARREYDQIRQWEKDRAQRLNELAGVQLEELALDLEALALRPRTAKKYAAEVRRFRAWCAAEEHWFEGAPMSSLPAAAGLVAVYLLDQLVRGRGYEALRLASAAISDAHHLAGHASPCADILVSAALSYAKRNAGLFKTKQQQHEVSDEQQQ